DGLLQQLDAVAALERGLSSQRASLALGPLLERKFQRRLEGRLELRDARQRAFDEVTDTRFGVGLAGLPAEDRAEGLVDYGMDQSGLAGEIAIGGGARHFGR